jgi:uncharacterized protein involved in oxidation of intracellular sulfur
MDLLGGKQMNTILIILNDAPYGSERTYNGLRLAGTLAKAGGSELRLFLMGDSVTAAKAGQKVPSGYYNVEVMLNAVIRGGAGVALCGTCLDARGITEAEIMQGAQRGTMSQLAEWTTAADRVLVF